MTTIEKIQLELLAIAIYESSCASYGGNNRVGGWGSLKPSHRQQYRTQAHAMLGEQGGFGGE